MRGRCRPKFQDIWGFRKRGLALPATATKSAAAGTARSPLDSLRIGLADAAKLIGKSETHVLALVKSGHIPRAAKGQYLATAVAQGALKFREDEDRRSSKTAEQTRIQAGRAREIELRNAREEGKLFDADDVETVFADILGTFRSELSGVPAASTRDLALRANIEKHLNAAVDRCRDSFTKASETLRAGGEVGVDAEDADA